MAAIGAAYAVAVASGSTPSWSSWIMAGAASFALVSTLALGAARSDQPQAGLRRLLLPFGAVLVIMLGAFAAALLLSAAGEPLLLGLPRRAAIVLYGVGLLPALILPIAYALTFDDLTLTEADIDRVRAAATKSTAE